LSEVSVGEVPYIYTATLSVNGTDRDQLDLAFDVKTAEELGFDSNQSAAYVPLLDVFAADAEIGSAISEITEEAAFNQTFNLLLPQRTNSSTEFLVSQSNASFGALADRLDLLAFESGQSRGFWIQEHATVVNRDDTADGPGFNGTGLGFSIGADQRLMGLDNVGVMLSYSSGEFEEKTGGRNPVRSAQLGFGAYVQEMVGPISVRAAAQIANSDFSSNRDVTLGDLFYQIEAEWGGSSGAASLGASTQWDAGLLYVRPELSVDWFNLSQDGYTETGGGGLLEAEVGEVETSRSSSSVMITLGRNVNIGIADLKIEASGGYLDVFSSETFETTVRYLGSDESFTLLAPEDPDNAALFGLSVSSNSEYAKLQLGYDMESSELGETHYIGASLRLSF
ncbi:MAG: autotransporter outer membrane beta-barrel domain-containing protein, partial [Pseudomonadota bacterium]